MELPDLGDQEIFAHTVDCRSRSIVLHVKSISNEPIFTDIIFSDVLFHHFEQQSMSSFGPSNVIFQIEETDFNTQFNEYGEIFYRLKKHGWPSQKYTELTTLSDDLRRQNFRCFEIYCISGLNGFVVCRSISFQQKTK